ncbi:DUF305 domain-containing protein [Streptomyces sp. Amel2xC10]|uniref:DUF305 domain-containing protein n=1 Tax=Streptomyces sp. Amel2xC10 TaxID=1305826 RepID=UPI000A086C46|nr:DUF305 domain-containing protein [Streptomyces sp. Amel2xC10]SME90298.1 Uncharacterized conserved protein, DUF305 family [Streptomyces sp. Amel2xC10]
MADTAAGEPRKRPPAAVLLCALTVLTAAACAGPAPAAGPTASTAAVAASGRLNATDIGWIQLMIAMDDQARRILALAPDRSGDPRLVAWATGVAEDHRHALAALRGLLADAGVADDNPHAGHDMPGMVNATELRALEHADGPDFDRLLRAALDEHLTQAAKLAGAVRKADADPEVKKLAREVATTTSDSRRRLPPAGTG